MIKEEGTKSLYKGFTAAILKNFVPVLFLMLYDRTTMQMGK